jgi:urea carboxylase
MGIASVAVYSEADADARMSRMADERLHRPGAGGAELPDRPRILDAARATGAGAIHPGYGFLSENPAFAEACEDAGIAFIGPTPRRCARSA